MTPASPALISALKSALQDFDWTVTAAATSVFTPAPTGSPLVAALPVTTVTISAYCETPNQDFVLTAIATLDNAGALTQLAVMAGGAMLDATDAALWSALSAMRSDYEVAADAAAVSSLALLGGS